MEQQEVPRRSVDLQDNPEILSPPIIRTPLYRCAKSVIVSGFVPHAEIDIEIDGMIETVRAGFPLPDGEIINLSDPLESNQQVRARQRTTVTESPWSEPVTVRSHTEDYPAGPPRPQINPSPVFECGSRTGVSNLLIGANVWIIANGEERGRVNGCRDHQGIDVIRDYGLGEEVHAWSELCQDPSPPSEKQITQTPPSPLPTPGFDPVYQGGEQLRITNIVNGARVTLYRNGTNQGTSRCWGYALLWGLEPPFTAGETFAAVQTMCPRDPPSDRGKTTVEPCSRLPAPLVGPVQYGDKRITLTDFMPDAIIKVYINLSKVGEGGGPVVQLTRSINYGDTVYVEQVLGTCQGQTIRKIIPGCVDPPLTYDPSALNLFPVGNMDYADGHIKGSVYYPANKDGVGESFNERLSVLGRVPIVFIAHGNHHTHYDPGNRLHEGSPNCGGGIPSGWVEIPNYKGYNYFQKQLAQMGIIAVSVNCNETNGCTACGPINIQDRVELINDSIEYFRQLDADNRSHFHQKINFGSVGLMGHSRGGNAVVWAPELISLPGVSIKSVLALAPTSCGFSTGIPGNCAFMTILPAGDGDVWSNDGAKYYDRAQPEPFKSQLYVHYANHNFFNREWLSDDSNGPAVMARFDHERILSVYGCAFFYSTLFGHKDTLRFLSGHMIPGGAATEHVHLSFEQKDAVTIDDHEDRNGIERNSLNMPTMQSGGMHAEEYPFKQATGAFNISFFGDSIGMVIEDRERNSRFRSQLLEPTDLTNREIWIRAAEVYNGSNLPTDATKFELGLEDDSGFVAWINSDSVGRLPRPYDLGSSTKTMLKTLRFRAGCFSAANRSFKVDKVVAILIRTTNGDQRALAFDDLQIV